MPLSSTQWRKKVQFKLTYKWQPHIPVSVKLPFLCKVNRWIQRELVKNQEKEAIENLKMDTSR